MARVLRRPMFRMGGNTDQGIMSGVAPRQRYFEAGSVEDVERRKEILRAGVGQAPDRSLSNFMIDFGLDIASRTPSGSIFSTAAEAAKEPFQGYKASKAARAGVEQQIGLTAATSSIEQMDEIKRIAMKNLNSVTLRVKLKHQITKNYTLTCYVRYYQAIATESNSGRIQVSISN